MSFLKKLFGVDKPDKHEYVQAMVEMAAESERTHRGMVSSYNADIELGLLPVPSTSATIIPTGRGIYKARLFGALFIAYAYAESGHAEVDVNEMVNVATGVALEPLVGGGEPSLDRDDAKSFAMAYLKPTLIAIIAAFKAGPLLSGHLAEEHNTLADQLHEALAESIGVHLYTPQVRENFAIAILGNVTAAMAHAIKWVVR